MRDKGSCSRMYRCASDEGPSGTRFAASFSLRQFEEAMPQHPPHPRPDDPTPMPPRPDPDPPPSPEDEPGSGPDKRRGKMMRRFGT
jgi:hypothetical protein